ncbi:MAG: M48 family metalloprotease [Pseudomonadota bacterium]
MFGNFIHFIIVLLIYATYQPVAETNFRLLESILLLGCLALLFALQAWISFRRLERRVSLDRLHQLDHHFNKTMLRQSILAISLFTINIYGLNLTSFLSALPVFSDIPTLQALFCLLLFIGYLSITWFLAHGAYQKIYATHFSRSEYVLSNIRFSVPILLPWLVLSGIADLLFLPPFEFTRRFLSTAMGQILYFLMFLLGISVIGPAMIQKFWRCKPMEPDYLRARIESLCEKAGMAYRDILYWPIFGGQMITAGIMGLIRRFRYILVTKALLHYLSADELDAVIAHEIGHVKKFHLFFYLMFFSGFMLLSLAFQNVFVYSLLYTKPIYRFLGEYGILPGTVKSAMDAVVFILVFLLYFRFVFGFFMRHFERQADTYVYALFESAAPLISTLKKIAFASGQPADKPNWHHFSIGERVRFLEKCEADRSWIATHNRKLKICIAVYLAGLLFIFAAGYQFNYGENGQAFFRHQLVRYLKSELSTTPGNPLLLSVLGDLYYEAKNFQETVAAYEKSLSHAPENPHVLNNLAWLYATCEDEGIRNPKRALQLSLLAVERERSAQVLDTLAESHFANGEIEAAIVTERMALELAKENREYFRKQLERFTARMKIQ